MIDVWCDNCRADISHCTHHVSIVRMENIPSANMRQHKLDQQRRLIEEKQRQKRAAQNKKIELSDLKSGAKSRPGSSSKGGRELHGYDGPLQYLSSQGNPDSMTTVQVSVVMMRGRPPRLILSHVR